MGEDGATELDPEKIFRHLCFYLDTPENAERRGMEVKPKHREQIANSSVFFFLHASPNLADIEHLNQLQQN